MRISLRHFGMFAFAALLLSAIFAGCGGSDQPVVTNPDAGLCNGGTTECTPGQCTQTSFDPNNCGTCGTKCPTGQACSGGKCSASECNGGSIKCGDKCVDTINDPANCGACGTACPIGQFCSGGKCDLNCNGGTTRCTDKCIDTANDPLNCGQCGNKCLTGFVCNQGACDTKCSAPTKACGQACVDTNNDPKNCGTCGNACPSGQFCTGGACKGTCGAGETQCGQLCVDTQKDVKNCGKCGTVCQGTDKCVAGACTPCDSKTTDCDADGWLESEGDCCDKPGACGAEPRLVNPGAIEVVGNGIDDNCNAKVDLFDTEDTQACDTGLTAATTNAPDFAKAIGICRTTTLTPPLKKDKTWGLIDAKLVRADGTVLGDRKGHSVRPKFGNSINPLNGAALAVLSSGMAADATQTLPGPNGGAPTGFNVTNTFSPASTVNISTCNDPLCVKDWFSTANGALKAANALPAAAGCGSANNSASANDSVMLVLTMRAPTNAKAFSFNSYFLSAEYPEFVCTNFNDQFIALVDTPNGQPAPIPNPVDKNLMTYTQNGVKYPIAINIAKATNVFSVCDTASTITPCATTGNISAQSCQLGATGLAGTGFEKSNSGTCIIGGGTYWLTTAGNIVPGDILQIRLVIWDVGDSAFDSTALIDGFQWLSNATLPGTSN